MRASASGRVAWMGGRTSRSRQKRTSRSSSSCVPIVEPITKSWRKNTRVSSAGEASGGRPRDDDRAPGAERAHGVFARRCTDGLDDDVDPFRQAVPDRKGGRTEARRLLPLAGDGWSRRSGRRGGVDHGHCGRELLRAPGPARVGRRHLVGWTACGTRSARPSQGGGVLEGKPGGNGSRSRRGTATRSLAPPGTARRAESAAGRGFVAAPASR